MSYKKKSISVVIPNYNGKHLIEAYLPHTLTALQNAATPYEVIIVDDCSSDDSVAFIRQNYSEVRLLINPQNRGFSYTCNQGIKAAGNELIMLLNSDVKLSPNYFETQWRYFEHPDTFGVMGRIADMDAEPIQDAARMPKLKGLMLKTDYFYYSPSPADDVYTYYLSGANALIDAAKLKEIGGLNELFSPFYYEDTELGLRAWRLNWKCYYEHSAVCGHLASATTKTYKTKMWVRSVHFRNKYFMHVLHLSGIPLYIYVLQVTFLHFLPLLLTGKFWVWKSYTALFGNWNKLQESKKHFEQLMARHGSKQSLFDVVKYIRASVKHKNLVKL